jgi:hypothetical protein
LTDDDLKIPVDATRPATLNDSAGKQTDFATLEDAVMAWRALPSAMKIRATVKLIGGPVYTAHQIYRLHHAPKQDEANENPGQCMRSDRGSATLSNVSCCEASHVVYSDRSLGGSQLRWAARNKLLRTDTVASKKGGRGRSLSFLMFALALVRRRAR